MFWCIILLDTKTLQKHSIFIIFSFNNFAAWNYYHIVLNNLYLFYYLRMLIHDGFGPNKRRKVSIVEWIIIKFILLIEWRCFFVFIWTCPDLKTKRLSIKSTLRLFFFWFSNLSWFWSLILLRFFYYFV